jgi:hypothetical protein
MKPSWTTDHVHLESKIVTSFSGEGNVLSLRNLDCDIELTMLDVWQNLISSILVMEKA